MRIIIDAMGGDNAPYEILKGTFSAADKCDADMTLVGNSDVILDCIKRSKVNADRFTVVHADSVIGMDDDPLSAIRKKKDSSMMVALKLLADGGGDALVSAGNTGALFSGATVTVRRCENIKRAAIGTLLPGTKPCLLLDAGANVTVTEEYLEQFAEIGSDYMRRMYGIERPAVGMLNNGTEECKGTSLQIETAKRLRLNSSVNFIGNVEASAVMSGKCDVVICDGFTGNIFLKATEGAGGLFLESLKAVYTKNLFARLSYMLVRKGLSNLKNRFDPSEYGGSPILGISKPVIKAHGASDARAFENAIYQAVTFAESGVIGTSP